MSQSAENDASCPDEYDCRCSTNPSEWRTPVVVSLTDEERQCAYPMEQGDFYLEDDVERIIAERMTSSPAEYAAATRVQRFLDERERPTPFAPRGFLPADFLGEITRTGDRLLVSDLRALLTRVFPPVKG